MPDPLSATDANDYLDLTQPFSAGTYHSAALPPPEFEQVRDVREDGVNVQRYAAATHVGTHADAPRHFVPGGATVDEVPLSRFAGAGVVLDVVRDGPDEVGVEAVRRAAEAVGGVDPGDVVLLRTGWGAHYDDHERYARYPWFGEAVAEFLLAREPRFVGVDTPSPDRPRATRPDDWDAYPVHRTLLPAGVPIVENLDLEPVAGCRDRLRVTAFPLRFRGGDGAPCRVVAQRVR